MENKIAYTGLVITGSFEKQAPGLIPLLLPDLRSFHSSDGQTLTVDLGQSLRIPCPAHGESYGATFSWKGTSHAHFKRNSRRAILPAGELFIMFVTDEDITTIENLKGIRCTMTGANTVYKSGPITLKKRRPGNDLLYYILYCIAVVCCGIRNSPLQKRERTGTSFLYCFHGKSRYFN